MMIGVSDEKLVEMVKQGNTSEICKLLDDIGVRKRVDGIPYGPRIRQILQIILTTASAAASAGKLPDELAEELIVRAAPCCELFFLLRLVSIMTDVKADGQNTVPEEITESIHRDSFSDEILANIENLDAATIKALISWILYDENTSKGIIIAFNIPIVSCMFKHRMIPTANLLSFISGSLREPSGGIDPLLDMLLRLYANR